MRDQNKASNKLDVFFKAIVILIILTGIAVRVAVFLQNRNLFIDEANIARNVFERNFFQLAAPLSYEQYAPPVFMWMLKLFTSIFGYGEYAFRLYPMLAGAGSLIVMYYLLKEITSIKSLWYPLGLMAVSYIMIRYSSELKQYMSDVLIILSLLLLALKTNIFDISKARFLLVWFIAGSVAIWGAMPSVFVLTGIGVYYLVDILRQKRWDKLFPLVLTGILWLVQFAVYYFLILKPQIESNYLQNFHQDYFLFATPENRDEWMHNINVVKNLIQEAGGYSVYSLVFNVAMLVAGCLIFLFRDFTKSLLFIIPLASVLVAAALNQYSLIPRVALFIMPLMLLLIGYGFDQLMNLRWKVIAVVAFLFGAKSLYDHSMVRMMWEKHETEQITDALDFLNDNGINLGTNVYVHNGARPAFIYYTQIHPDQQKWERIEDAHLLSWDADYNSIAENTAGKTALIFTSVYPDDLAKTRGIMEQHNIEIAKLEKQGCFAYVYERK